MRDQNFQTKQFIIITLLTSIWVHASEIFRAEVFVFERMQAFFNYDPSIGKMELSNAIIWGIWDTILTVVLVFVFWLYAKTFGNNLKSILISATIVWAATIGVFWIAAVNSGLGNWSTAMVALPLAWIEMAVGAWIASKLYATNRWVDYQNIPA